MCVDAPPVDHVECGDCKSGEGAQCSRAVRMHMVAQGTLPRPASATAEFHLDSPSHGAAGCRL